jgi:hypothetical protein
LLGDIPHIASLANSEGLHVFSRFSGLLEETTGRAALSGAASSFGSGRLLLVLP